MRRFLTLPNVILLSLVLGLLFGWLAGRADLFARAPVIKNVLDLGGELFKNLIFMVIVPLVAVSLIAGMMAIGDMRKLGRIAAKTIALYAFTAAVACTMAVLLVNAIKPGKAVSEETRVRIEREHAAEKEKSVKDLRESRYSLWTFLAGIVPRNIFAAFTNNGAMLSVIFFALFFGLTAATLDAKRRDVIFTLSDALSTVMIRMIHLVMYAAPIGVFCLIAVATAQIGISVVKALGLYCLVVLLGLAIQFFVVYGGVLKVFTRLRFVDFVRACRPALITAFSTSSSAASLPVNMECVSRRLNVSPQVTSFVLPIGTTVNMDGTAIMQSVAAVFLAQIYLPEPLTIAQQLGIILTAMLASVGTAPVPAAGIAMLLIILEPLKIPAEGLALIWAVDRPLDMARTVVNVVGDGVAAAAVAASEGEDVRYVPEGTVLPERSPSVPGPL